jgi:Zn-dependent protease
VRFESGFLVVGRLFGVPVRVHWAMPLGALWFSRFRVEPVVWAAFFGLVLAHELGHALVVRANRARATSVEVHVFGGLCRWRGEVTPLGRAAIAWGGIWAQMVVLALALLWAGLAGPAGSDAEWQVRSVCVSSNLWMIGLNLLPIPPLDGSEAWKLFPLLRTRIRRRWWKAAYGAPPRKPVAPIDPDGPVPPEVESLVDRIVSDATRKERGP